MSNALKELHHYQELKLRSKKLGMEQAALVGGTAITDAMGRLSWITSELAAIEETISQTKRMIKRLEDENSEIRAQLNHSESKLYDGSIAHAKELTQMQQKIETYRQSSNRTEEKILELMEIIEEKEAKVQKIQGDKEDLSKALNELERNNRLENARYEQEIELTETEASRIKENLSPELLAIYDRQSRAHHGVAIAPLQGDTCGACHVSLSSAMVQRIKRDQNTVHTCENCGRIVYWP